MHRQPRLLFGTSTAITRALDQCGRYARATDPIVLMGDPGTGKTVLAEHIHRLSGRLGDFVKVSASHIPQHLELAHLGGHSRGAYTGAERDEAGLLEAAHKGTFFLERAAIHVNQITPAAAEGMEVLCQELLSAPRRPHEQHGKWASRKALDGVSRRLDAVRGTDDRRKSGGCHVWERQDRAH